MGIKLSFLKCTVASFLAIAVFSGPALAVNEARLDDLYTQLKDADRAEAIRLAREIERERSNSGSSAMNLLLKRGEDALEAGDLEAALNHFTALTDHAPEFAEGWHRRAQVFVAMEKYGPAVADLERVLKTRPRHYDAIATLGGILVQINKPEKAKEAFEQALAIHPHHPEVTEALDYLDPQVGGTEL
ncbi:MAG: tetratricopeptide repeat protein [Pseudomonadota bacterium]